MYSENTVLAGHGKNALPGSSSGCAWNFGQVRVSVGVVSRVVAMPTSLETGHG